MRIPIQTVCEQLFNEGSAVLPRRQADAMEDDEFGFASVRSIVLVRRRTKTCRMHQTVIDRDRKLRLLRTTHCVLISLPLLALEFHILTNT